MGLAANVRETKNVPEDGLSGDLARFVPADVYPLNNPQTDLPRIAKDKKLIRLIEDAVRKIPTRHVLNLGDAREMSNLAPGSVHLIVTSPPYWTLKEYRDSEGQMGHIEDYDEFLTELDKVWAHCFRALVPGGRLICVVGDVCLSRKKNNGRHTVVPLHASIQEHCRKLGFDNLAPIIWHKISNAAYEVENGSSFLGKPYEPNSVIKNDIEFILMERKPGRVSRSGYSNASLKRHFRRKSQGMVPANLVGGHRRFDSPSPRSISNRGCGAPGANVQLRGRYGARPVPGNGHHHGRCCPNWQK